MGINGKKPENSRQKKTQVRGVPAFFLFFLFSFACACVIITGGFPSHHHAKKGNVLKTLLHYLKKFTKESILGPLFKLLEAALELITPLIVAAVIDRGIAAGDVPYTVKMCLLLVGFGLVGLAFSVTAQYFAAKAATGAVSAYRSALFRHIGTLSYADLDKLGSSTLITRLTSDANQVQSGINLTLRLLLRSPFVVFGAMIMALSVNAEAAVPFVIVIPALSVVVFGIMLLCMPLYKKVQTRLDGVMSATRENLSGVRVVRAFRKEGEEIDAFRQKNDGLTAVQKTVGRVSALLNPLTLVLINLAVIALLRLGALRVDAGTLTQGQLIALYNYMSQILVELIKLANLIISITKAVACAGRLDSVMQTRPSQTYPDAAPAAVPGAPAVEFRNVSLRYPAGGADAVSGLSFRVMPGETVGIIGGTGSGKSTLIHLIPRFYDATAGEVLIDGVPVAEYPKLLLRRKIGVVPQKAELFHGTVRDNLRWAKPDATDEELSRALDVAQALGVVESKGGLSFTLEQGGRNLSGGQKQRLTIARALVGDPDILILDDSSSALDYATDAALRHALRERCRGTTVFLVSQRTSSIAHADKIITLDDGHIVGIGTHEELLAGCEVYREIYDSQFRKESRAQ